MFRCYYDSVSRLDLWFPVEAGAAEGWKPDQPLAHTQRIPKFIIAMPWIEIPLPVLSAYPPAHTQAVLTIVRSAHPAHTPYDDGLALNRFRRTDILHVLCFGVSMFLCHV